MATDDILIDRHNNCDLNNTTTVFIEKKIECNKNNDNDSNSRLISANGTLIGTLLSSSSLKIHVNQSSDPNTLNKSNISIVNCSNNNNSKENINVPTNSDNDNVDEIIEVHSNNETEPKPILKSIEPQSKIVDNIELKLVANSNNVNRNSTNDNVVESRPRRGERRERRRDRQSRCLHHNHQHHQAGSATTITATANPPNSYPNTTICRPMDILPTLMPPPYTTLPGRGSSTTQFVPSSLLTTVGPVVDDLHYSFPIPMIRRSPSERSGKGCCFRWFSGSPFRVVLCVLALGGITCAIGGICIGTTTIIGSSASHLTTSLIMIGFGIIILTLSGLAWKFSVSTTNFCWNDFDTCSRRSYNRTQRGIYYPEFQHRPPPPSYQASMQEYRLRLLLLDRERPINIIRVPSPPPTYRSYKSTLARNTLNQSDANRPPSYNTTNTNNNNQARLTTAVVAHQQNHQTEIVPEQMEQQKHDYDEHEKITDSSKSDCKIKLENNEKNVSNMNNNELVTIVTISGYTDNEQGSNEMEVLAHL